jgi:hypothetical protein
MRWTPEEVDAQWTGRNENRARPTAMQHYAIKDNFVRTEMRPVYKCASRGPNPKSRLNFSHVKGVRNGN